MIFFSKKNFQSPLTVLRGPIVHEVHQKINSWIYQVVLIFSPFCQNMFLVPTLDVTFSIGPCYFQLSPCTYHCFQRVMVVIH